jgi:hypothetical protein
MLWKESIFVENVEGCLGARYFIRLCNAADYKRWAKT